MENPINNNTNLPWFYQQAIDRASQYRDPDFFMKGGCVAFASILGEIALSYAHQCRFVMVNMLIDQGEKISVTRRSLAHVMLDDLTLNETIDIWGVDAINNCLHYINTLSLERNKPLPTIEYEYISVDYTTDFRSFLYNTTTARNVNVGTDWLDQHFEHLRSHVLADPVSISDAFLGQHQASTQISEF